MKTLELERVFDQKRGELLDFIISGRSLLKELRRRGYDVVPRLLGRLLPVDVETRNLLLLEREGDTPTGRVTLYVCPLCRHLGCGVVSARIKREGSDISWSDFAWETDCEDGLQPLERLGPYRFREAEYRAAIMNPPQSNTP